MVIQLTNVMRTSTPSSGYPQGRGGGGRKGNVLSGSGMLWDKEQERGQGATRGHGQGLQDRLARMEQNFAVWPYTHWRKTTDLRS